MSTFSTPRTTTIVNPRLKVLNALRNNYYPLLTFLATPSLRQAQIVAQTGLDGVILDCEHGHIADDAMHNAVAGIAGLGVSPIIRVRGPSHDILNHDILKRALDTGAHGVLVPQVNNAIEAQQIVDLAKFPPQGIRGQGSVFHAFAHGLTIPEYMKSANETILTMIQIETRAGVENVDEICAVPGVDVVFVGPNDLALSLLGYTPARGDEPGFSQAIERISQAAMRHGKWVSRLVNDGNSAREMKGKFDMVPISTDAKALTAWYRAELGQARS